MTLKLESVLFDRETSGGNRAALPVRVNGGTGVPQVDWRRTGANIDATAVAYPLTLSAGDVGDLRITVTFTVSSTPSAPFFVRATGQGGRLLGDVLKTQITPGDIGNSHQLRVDDVLLRNAAVGEHTVDWKWEQSADGNSGWQEFDRLTHQVFVTVNQPEAPWGRPGTPDTIVPWHDPMKLACTWANGTRDAAAVMEAITAAVDKLAGTYPSGRVVRYHEWGSLCGDRKFSVPQFLGLVHDQPGMPTKLNCRDLNTAVAINATLLGCPLRVLRLRPADQADDDAKIATNPIKVFGEQTTGPRSFSFHEVAAIPGPPIDNRQVWDACLRVDFDSQPQSAPGQFRLPAGVAIHQTRTDLGYRKRLLTPGQEAAIEEVAGDGLRYPVTNASDPVPGEDDVYFRQRREHFTALMRQAPNSLPQPGMPSNALQTFLETNAQAEGFPRNVDVGDPPATLVFTPLRPLTNNGPLESSAVLAANRRQALAVFAALAAQYNGTLKPHDNLGDFTLYDPGSDAVLMLRGSIVAEISGDGRTAPSPPALSEAIRLDDALNQFFETPSR